MEILLILLGLFFYFLPAIIGSGKRNAGAIWVLNIFLGWTFIGWIVALVWACTNDSESVKIVQQQDTIKHPDKIDEIKRLKELLDNGAITESEFNIEKQKILSNATLSIDEKAKQYDAIEAAKKAAQSKI